LAYALPLRPIRAGPAVAAGAGPVRVGPVVAAGLLRRGVAAARCFRAADEALRSALRCATLRRVSPATRDALDLAARIPLATLPGELLGGAAVGVAVLALARGAVVAGPRFVSGAGFLV